MCRVRAFGAGLDGVSGEIGNVAGELGNGDRIGRSSNVEYLG